MNKSIFKFLQNSDSGIRPHSYTDVGSIIFARVAASSALAALIPPAVWPTAVPSHRDVFPLSICIQQFQYRTADRLDGQTRKQFSRQLHLVSIKLEKNLNPKYQLQQPQPEADIPAQWGMDLSGGMALTDSTGTEGQEHLRCPRGPWLWWKTWSLSHSQRGFGSAAFSVFIATYVLLLKMLQ